LADCPQFYGILPRHFKAGTFLATTCSGLAMKVRGFLRPNDYDFFAFDYRDLTSEVYVQGGDVVRAVRRGGKGP
jgi:hypothetical protein